MSEASELQNKVEGGQWSTVVSQWYEEWEAQVCQIGLLAVGFLGCLSGLWMRGFRDVPPLNVGSGSHTVSQWIVGCGSLSCPYGIWVVGALWSDKVVLAMEALWCHKEVCKWCPVVSPFRVAMGSHGFSLWSVSSENSGV